MLIAFFLSFPPGLACYNSWYIFVLMVVILGLSQNPLIAMEISMLTSMSFVSDQEFLLVFNFIILQDT